MNRFVIVGAGRSGTTFCQAVHQVCGIPTSHQKVFNWDNDSRPVWTWRDTVGEASFMAVPLLQQIRHQEPETRIVLVKRDIEATAESWVARGAFGDDMAEVWPNWHRIVSQMFPSALLADTPVERAWRYVQAWNIYAAAYSDAVLQLEDMKLADLFAATGQTAHYDAVLAGSISTSINHGPP